MGRNWGHGHSAHKVLGKHLVAVAKLEKKKRKEKGGDGRKTLAGRKGLKGQSVEFTKTVAVALIPHDLLPGKHPQRF